MADKALADIWVKKTTDSTWTKLALINKRSFKTFGSLNITDFMKNFLLFLLSIDLSEPYNRISIRDSSFKFLIEASIR